MKRKILLIYASYGTGHKAVSNAIENYFLDIGSEYEILKVDLLQEMTPFFGRISKKFLEKLIVGSTPIFFEIMYRVFDHRISTLGSNYLFSKIYNKKGIRRLIVDFNPDLTISTHFFGSTLIAAYNKKGLIKSKLITLVTDYKAHQMWLKNYKMENAIVVNSEEEKKLLVKKGIPQKKIYSFGVPIYGSRFKVENTREQILQKLGFNPEEQFILFIGGSGYETAMSYPYLKKLVEMKIPANVLFVCGHSTKLKAKAEKLIKEEKVTNIKIAGFVNNMGELMDTSDFIITKPGGAIVSECLYFRKPMILINRTGGQETDNYRYLVKKKVGLRALTLKSFETCVNKTLFNPATLKNMHKNLMRIEKQDAINKLYDLAKKTLEE